MPENFYHIGLDLGTSAIKGVLLSASDSRIIATASRLTTYNHPHPDWVEADPNGLFADLTAVIRELAAAAPGSVKSIAAAAASGNTLLTDAAGTPLTPVINWMDKRCVNNLPPTIADLTPAEIRQITGWPCHDIFPLAHIAWFRQHQPRLLDSAAHVCMNTDWLLYRLCGRWLMDHSTATTSLLQNQTTLQWHTPFLDRLGIRPDQLSCLVPSGAIAAPLTPAAAAATGLTTATVAVTGTFDHPSAARAVGVLKPGQLMLSCGTSWVAFLPAPQRSDIVKAELLCDPFLSTTGGPWAGMFSVPAIGPTIDWYVENLIAPNSPAPLKVFDDLAAATPHGAHGLTINLEAPPQHLSAPPAHIARAVMEGAARALANRIAKLRQYGFEFESAVMVGGPSKSPIWPNIVATTTGLKITVGSAHAGAAGAAMLAAKATT